MMLDALRDNLLCIYLNKKDDRQTCDALLDNNVYMCKALTTPSNEGGLHFTTLCINSVQEKTIVAATVDTINKLTSAF